MTIRNFPRMALAAFVIVFLPIAVPASDKASTANTTITTNNGRSADNESTNSAPAAATIALDPLLRVLLSQGILNAEEAHTLAGIPPAQLRDRLLLLLLTRDVSALSAADVNSLSHSTGIEATADPAAAPATPAREASPQSSGPPQPPPTPPPGGPIPAITPIRALQIDTPKREGIIPAIKIGTRVNVAPYGFFKASVVYDSSSPYGNDFPLPGFNGLPNTLNAIPEFRDRK